MDTITGSYSVWWVESTWGDDRRIWRIFDGSTVVGNVDGISASLNCNIRIVVLSIRASFEDESEGRSRTEFEGYVAAAGSDWNTSFVDGDNSNGKVDTDRSASDTIAGGDSVGRIDCTTSENDIRDWTVGDALVVVVDKEFIDTDQDGSVLSGVDA